MEETLQIGTAFMFVDNTSAEAILYLLLLMCSCEK